MQMNLLKFADIEPKELIGSLQMTVSIIIGVT